MAPLVVVFLAWPILGERITAVRLAAVVLGFAGVLMVIRPGSSVFQWASVLLLGSAICYASTRSSSGAWPAVDHPGDLDLLQRAAGRHRDCRLLVPFVWKAPRDWGDWR